MGDSVPGGAFANLPATWPVNAGMAVGAECMLGENWDTQTIDRTLTSIFSLWLSTVDGGVSADHRDVPVRPVRDGRVWDGEADGGVAVDDGVVRRGHG